jgi:hypothetical protein
MPAQVACLLFLVHEVHFDIIIPDSICRLVISMLNMPSPDQGAPRSLLTCDLNQHSKSGVNAMPPSCSFLPDQLGKQLISKTTFAADRLAHTRQSKGCKAT